MGSRKQATTCARVPAPLVFGNLLVCGLLVLATQCCSGNSTVVVTDTTGAQFAGVCLEPGCWVEPEGNDDCGDRAILLTNHYLAACTIVGEESLFPDNCRVVVCKENADCPSIAGVSYSCFGGTCSKESSPRGAVSVFDVFSICLRNVSRKDFCRRSVFVTPGVEEAQLAHSACTYGPEQSTAAVSCSEVPPQCLER